MKSDTKQVMNVSHKEIGIELEKLSKRKEEKER